MKTPPQKKENGVHPPIWQSRGREAELREFEIHKLLSERTIQRKRYRSLPMWNCTTLGEKLGYTRQCIASDIEYMIAKGYPIARDPVTQGLYYTQSFTPMLAQVITEGELTRLFLAVRAIEALKDSPIFAPVLTDLQKLIAALIDKLGVDYTALSACITIKNTGIDPYVEAEVLEQLVTAIRERQELEIVYSKLNHGDGCSARVPRREEGDTTSASDNNPTETIPHPSAPWLPLQVETRTAHPLHIYCLDHVWYLYLWDPMRKAQRKFMLSRMHSIRQTGQTFKARRFNAKKQIDDRLLVTSGDPVKVRVQFRGKASYLVAERPWHHTQELAPGPDSEWNLEATLNVAITPELIRWLMGYDQDFRVLEPASLAEAIDRKVKAMHNLRKLHPAAPD